MSGLFGKLFGGGAQQDIDKAKKAYDLRMPFEIMSGAEAPARLEAALSAKDGRSSPLLLNDDDLTGVHAAIASQRRQSPTAIIEAAQSFDVAGFFAKQRADYEAPGGLLNGEEAKVIVGEWQNEGYEAEGLKAHLGGGWTGRKPAAQVALLKVPTPRSEEIPAYLNYGGFDDCPPPHAVVAIARDWRERFGAELVAISTHVLQFRVARRPATRDEALALAMEHFLFCSNIVEPADWTLNQVAEGLLTETHWLFVFDRNKEPDVG